MVNLKWNEDADCDEPMLLASCMMRRQASTVKTKRMGLEHVSFHDVFHVSRRDAVHRSIDAKTTTERAGRSDILIMERAK